MNCRKHNLVIKRILTVFILAAGIFFVFSPSLQADQNVSSRSKNYGGRFVVSGIIYRNQNEKGSSQWCVIYSTVMLLSSFGIEEDPDRLAEAVYMTHRSQPYFSWNSVFSGEGSVEKYIWETYSLESEKKLFVTLRDSIVEWIKEKISQGSPILLLYGRLDGHGVLVSGYDDEYIYFHDPSGALFSDAGRQLGKRMLPVRWSKIGRISPYEGAAMRWDDFKEFIRLRNFWGYMMILNKNNN